MSSSDPAIPDALTSAAALRSITSHAWVAQALHAAAKLGIADLLAEGSRSSAELAAATATHAPSLHRLLRALASVGIFAQDGTGRFTLTPLASALRTGVPGSLRAWVIFMGEAWHRQAWSELLQAVTTGQPAFERVFGMQAFDYFRNNPAAGQVFNDAMTSVSSQVAEAIVSAYSFAEFGTLIDVGGGHGLLLASVLRANPLLRGVLYDLPEVVADAGNVLEAAGVAPRCRIEGGDFFRDVPIGGDAYMLKSIIHDWDDERCTTILTHCRDRMRPGGKVLLIECVIPQGNDPHPGKLLDLEMLVVTHGGKERTESEFRALFGKAGLKLDRVVQLTAPASVIETSRA
jgi:hypothetical protein